MHQNALFESVPLHYGETIIDISCRYNQIIIGIILTTSTGKTYAFGDYQSGVNVILNIPLGKKVIGLAGEYQQYLHNLSCYYC